MDKRFRIFISLQLLILVNLIAQEPTAPLPQNIFGLSTGICSHIVKDDLMSPLIYKGTQSPIYISGKYLNSNTRFSLSLFYDELDLESSITDKSYYLNHYSKNTNILLDCSLNKKFYSFENIKLTCFAGGKLKLLINSRDHYYTTDVDYVFGDNMASGDINFFIEKHFSNSEKSLMYFNFSMPLAAVVYNNNKYNANVTKNPSDYNSYFEVVTINKLFEVQTELSFVHFFGRYVGFELKHQFHFFYLDKYEDLLHSKFVINQYLFGLIVKI